MFESVGCIVKRLKRTKEAGLNLGHLPLGRWRKLSESEVNMLKKKSEQGRKNHPKKTVRVSTVKTQLKNTRETQNQKSEPVPKKKPHYSGNGIQRSKNNSTKSLETDIIKVFITEK